MNTSAIPTLNSTPSGSNISPQKSRMMSVSSISRSGTSSRVSPRTVRLQSMSMRGTSRSSPRAHDGATSFPERRRISYSVDDISHHALDRLGVNTDILKKEKGMKKLGISDIDIALSEELRRYSGISVKTAGPATKAELVFGFTEEQLLRDKALKRLGTTEEEIMDDYSKRVSALGESDAPLAMR